MLSPSYAPGLMVMWLRCWERCGSVASNGCWRPSARRLRDLAVALIAARILRPCSKLATSRGLNADDVGGHPWGRVGGGGCR